VTTDTFVVWVRSAGELLTDSVVVSLPNLDVVDKSVAAPEIVVLWSTGELDSSWPSAVEFFSAVPWSPPVVDEKMSAREIVLLTAGEVDSSVEFASAVDSVENLPVEPDDVVEKSDDAVETSLADSDLLEAVDSSSDELLDELLDAVDSSSDELLAARTRRCVPEDVVENSDDAVETSLVDSDLLEAVDSSSDELPDDLLDAVDSSSDELLDELLDPVNSSSDELLAAVDSLLVKAEEPVEEISFAIADMVVDDSFVELKASVEKVGDEVVSF
jgi:hypothetical protein